jgi:hypothetical protein
VQMVGRQYVTMMGTGVKELGDLGACWGHGD